MGVLLRVSRLVYILYVRLTGVQLILTNIGTMNFWQLENSSANEQLKSI